MPARARARGAGLSRSAPTYTSLRTSLSGSAPAAPWLRHAVHRRRRTRPQVSRFWAQVALIWAVWRPGSPRRAALVEPHAASTSLLSQRPAHPTHRPGRARPRGPSRRRPAAVGVRNGCPDLPAGCLRAACRCSAACCWSSACQPCLLVCSGPAAAILSLFELCSVRQLSGVFGGAGGAARGIGRVQKRVLWSDLNGRPVLSF